ncbi:hypothetical protein [Kribbella sp. DT2]|uniref:hypothetical protein n=1 Tax=Kribbella sp. DT2 TaxID=3393427 RepID=UPI003CED3280
MRTPSDAGIRHVLLDADGVLQDLPGGWYAAMEPYVGERAREFLDRTWADELPMLAGRGDYLPILAATLQEYGVLAPLDEAYAANITARNVDGARGAGLIAEQWDFTQGHDVLRDLFAAHGVVVGA